MPFKRKARILFVSYTPFLAEVAARYANNAGQAWIVATCAAEQCADVSMAVAKDSLGDVTCRALHDAAGMELELVVTLDENVLNCCPVWPGTTRHRHYPITLEEAAGAQPLAEIRQLVDGIVGGFKMLEKSGTD